MENEQAHYTALLPVRSCQINRQAVELRRAAQLSKQEMNKQSRFLAELPREVGPGPQNPLAYPVATHLRFRLLGKRTLSFEFAFDQPAVEKVAEDLALKDVLGWRERLAGAGLDGESRI